VLQVTPSGHFHRATYAHSTCVGARVSGAEALVSQLKLGWKKHFLWQKAGCY
jgi:hypothetical protein